MKRSADFWKTTVAAAVNEVESQCRAYDVSVIRGSFLGEKATVVRVDSIDWNMVSGLLSDGSLCVIDFRLPPAPVDKDPALRDLHIYVRLGTSDTWLSSSVETPEEDDPNEVPEDEIDYSWDREHSVDEATMNTLAIRVAKEVGFGSLRNKSERADFARSSLAEATEYTLNEYDFWAIGTLAETFFRTGIAPTTAKLLESQGKSVSEIARAMGLSKPRVVAALETNVPRHVAKLIASTQ